MASPAEGVAHTEGSTPARIREAAVVRFGRDGFGVGLRAIAADAGVAAGLIIHYFGSKDGLRRACDEHVLELVRVEKEKAVTDGSASSLIARMAEVERFAPVVRYLLRSFQAGGQVAAEMAEHMIADAQAYLAAGEAAGVIRPSRDPAARTRFLAYQNLGSLVVWFTLHPDDGDDAHFVASLRDYAETISLPALELFGQGLFVDRSMLDDYLRQATDPASTVRTDDIPPADTSAETTSKGRP